MAAEDFAPDLEPPPDDFDDDFVPDPDDFALAPEDDDRDFADAPEDDRSDPDDFARAPVDEDDVDDLALGREDFLAEVDFGLVESVSFTPSMTRAPALATASAPSATVSPIDRSASPACRRAPDAAFFTDLVAALAVRLVVPLPLFFA